MEEGVSTRTAKLETERRQAEAAAEALRRDIDSKVEEAVSAVTSELQAGLKERDVQLERAHKRVGELQRQLDEKPSYSRGGIQESELIQLLKKEFPSDRVELVKGRSGADIEHEVFDRGESCGVILYESKNVQNWNSDFVTKLSQDKLASGASFAILVTTAFPSKASDLTMIDGIPVVHPRFVISIASVVRRGLIEVKLQSLSQRDRGSKLEVLINYLNSPDFKNRVDSVLKAVDDLEDLQTKEKRYHQNLWEDETKLQRTIRNSSSDISSELTGIIAGR